MIGTVFDICFLAPVYLFLAFVAILALGFFFVWFMSVLERFGEWLNDTSAIKELEGIQSELDDIQAELGKVEKLKAETKKTADEPRKFRCPKCREIVSMSYATFASLAAARVSELAIRCGCGHVMTLQAKK